MALVATTCKVSFWLSASLGHLTLIRVVLMILEKKVMSIGLN
jgi:hypothetical protein